MAARSRTSSTAAGRRARIDALLAAGAAAQERGDRGAAEQAFRKVLALDPTNAVAVQLLGAVLVDRDDIDEALDLFEAAAEPLGPPTEATFGFYNNYANALRRADRFPSAEKMLRKLLEIDPRSWHAWHNLGQTLHQLDRPDEAAAALRRAVMIEPNFAPNHGVLGAVLHKLGRLNSAEYSLRRCLELAPNDMTALTLLGNNCRLLGRTDEAVEHLTRALALIREQSPGAHSNLGIALLQGGHVDEAVEHFARAQEIQPENNTWHAHLSYALLITGQLEAAWPEWEYGILDGPRGQERETGVPRWTPAITDGRVLVYREQGVGDEIIFASCYPDLIAAANDVLIECDSRLVTLFARSFPQAAVRAQTMDQFGRETRHDYDSVIPAGSLPPIFRPTIEAFPDRRSYLVPDEARVAAWRERLAEQGPGPYVGISWRSKVKTAERRLEYTRLEEWGEIFATPDVTWVNLQYDDCDRELHDAETRFGVHIARWDWLDLLNDFDEVAALISALDFVISPRNAVAMLSGAVGVDAAVMCNRFAWIDLGTDNCPWVPTLRIIARNPNDDWDAVLSTTAQLVGEVARSASRV